MDLILGHMKKSGGDKPEYGGVLCNSKTSCFAKNLFTDITVWARGTSFLCPKTVVLLHTFF
jgi:hypothetical protein